MQTDSGKIEVYRPRSNGQLELLWEVTGNQLSAKKLGSYLVGLPDLNGDGHGDVDSLIESCKLNDHEPYRYLKETLQMILNEKPFFMPAQYSTQTPK